jgi:hypothetical protein
MFMIMIMIMIMKTIMVVVVWWLSWCDDNDDEGGGGHFKCSNIKSFFPTSNKHASSLTYCTLVLLISLYN